MVAICAATIDRIRPGQGTREADFLGDTTSESNYLPINRRRGKGDVAVAESASQCNGGALIKTHWPKDDRPLSRDARIALQKKLSELGYKVNDFEGHIDFDLRDNIRAEQKKFGILPDGNPNGILLNKLGVAAR